MNIQILCLWITWSSRYIQRQEKRVASPPLGSYVVKDCLILIFLQVPNELGFYQCRWHRCSVQSHSVRQDSDICQKLAIFKRFMSKITSSGELSASASCSKWESVAGSRQVLEKNLVSYSYCVSDFHWKLN